MNKAVLTFALAIFLSFVGTTASRAANHVEHRQVLRAIQTNADAARRDAAIYQWNRVNRQVDRIVADEKKLQKSMASHEELKTQLKTMRETVSDLRSARLKRDSDRLVDIAKKLSALAADLLKKEPEPVKQS